MFNMAMIDFSTKAFGALDDINQRSWKETCSCHLQGSTILLLLWQPIAGIYGGRRLVWRSMLKKALDEGGVGLSAGEISAPSDSIARLYRMARL